MFSRLIWLVALFLTWGIPAHAQLRPDNLTAYKEKDGLPGMDISNLIVDRLGYVWTGTINGMGKFDGYHFQRFYFNPNDSSSVHGLVIWSLFEDRKGYVWAGTSPSNLNRYDPATRSFRHYPFTRLFPYKSGVEINVIAVEQDDRGRLYFGLNTYYGDSIRNALLYMDAGDTAVHVFPAPDSLPIYNITFMHKGPDGAILFMSRSGLMQVDRNGKLSRIRVLDKEFGTSEYPADFAVDSGGRLYIATDRSRLLVHDPSSGMNRAFSVEPAVLDYYSPLLLDPDGDLWIGGVNGLFRFNRKEGRVIGFPSGTGLVGPGTIRALVKDAFGSIWIGSGKDGLWRYAEKSRLRSFVHNAKESRSITAGWAHYLAEASDGKLWVATGGNFTASGLNIIDPGTGAIRPIPFLGIGERINGILGFWEAAPGKMMLSIPQRGLHELDLGTLSTRHVTLPGIPDTGFVQRRLLDREGNEWLCSALNGVYRRKKGESDFQRIDFISQPGANLTSNAVSRMVETSGGIWFLSDNGLFFFDRKTGAFSRHGYDRSKGDVFVTQDINSLYDDGAGTVWVGAWQGGLSKYEPASGRIITYTRNDGLPSNSIQGILPDQKNHSLWLSTFEGLSRLDLNTGQFSNYGMDDGIQSLLFADGSQLRTSKGLIVFGGSNGITIFDPDSITMKTMPPKVFLTDLKLFNKTVLAGKGSILSRSISETDSIVLAHDQNNLTLEYVGIHYANPSLNRYAYKLENYDADWREVGDQRAAFYSSLPPGHYVFRVKAANDKGIWNEKGATLHITILPPWWRTTWAYVLYGLLLALLAFGVDRYFRARIVARERERNQARELEQAREIQKAYGELGKAHEELKSAQTQLVHAEKMASLGELTAGIAHEIQNPLNFVNNFAEINRDLIVEVFDAQSRGDVDEVQALLGDIRDNEGKIRLHGQRADAIVKSMLQHSRASTGQKEPTDLAALADEYLKLAYHGMRAKDKAFNVAMETDFEAGLPKVNVIPQDIGRVLLNLYNNAFQAVMERKKNGEAGYEPKVRVEVRGGVTAETLRRGGTANNSEFRIQNPELITLRVIDNGPGIPEAIRGKIFQPFFTTKPTGQGTGLGLSLSYDIVKAHGGVLTVRTDEGKGAEFTFDLPVNGK